MTDPSRTDLPLLSLDERLLIEDLLSAYVIACDLHEVDTVVSLFTEDGEFRVFDRVFTGPSDLRKMLTHAAKGLHLGGRAIITPAGEGATVRQQLVFYPADRSQPRLTIYDDVVVQVDGRWIFRSRQVRFMDAEGQLQNRP